MNTWKPISTAPRDTRVLVTRIPFTNRAPVRIARFKSNRLKKHQYPWRSGHERLQWEPTHWCEIPAVPGIPPEQLPEMILHLVQDGPVAVKEGIPRHLASSELDHLTEEILRFQSAAETRRRPDDY